jgi:hypothetical protein
MTKTSSVQSGKNYPRKSFYSTFPWTNVGITGGFKRAPFLQFLEVLWSEIASGIYLPYSQKNSVPPHLLCL